MLFFYLCVALRIVGSKFIIERNLFISAAVLQAIPDNEEIKPTTKDAQGVLDVIQLINNIESQSK